jgi:hypothetical protein
MARSPQILGFPSLSSALLASRLAPRSLQKAFMRRLTGAMNGLPLLDLNVELGTTIASSDRPRAIQTVERKIRQAHPEITRIFVEASALAKFC